MSSRARARSAVRTAVVWDVLRETLAARTATGRDDLEVLDVGGGTGGFAVPLAELGHVVTVLEPSPDALAALDRRVAEAGVGERVRAVQGDTSNIGGLAPAGNFDLVLCHGVLEHVDDPAEAVAALTGALRPGGFASVLAANRDAVVLARAVSGHIAEAGRALVDPAGRWGPRDPMPRRFAPDEIVGLLTDAGLEVVSTHGVRVFSDLVPAALTDAEPGTLDALLDLEARAAEHPAFRAVATQLHVLSRRR